MSQDTFYHWFWQQGCLWILYGVLLVVGLWTSKQIMFTTIKDRYHEWHYRYRIRLVRSSHGQSDENNYNNAFLDHLRLLIRTTSDNRNEFDVLILVTFSALIGITSCLFMLISFGDLLTSLLFGILLSTMPYLYLRVRLNKLRYRMSVDFIYIVQRLTQHYNALHHDIYHALAETQKEITDPVLRKVLIRLISDLQVSRNEHDLRKSIKVFIYTSGTNWSKRLGSIILKAFLYKENVLNALIVLTKQMEETSEMLEEEKSQTIDAVYNGYLTIPLFIGSLFLGKYTANSQNWFSLQFGNKWNLFLFCLSLLGVLFSVIISSFLKRPKNDL
ncbi:hypothetical protein HPT25_26265 [Bacillus sp. BRMEA1]|uniref:hypothetical protein n=1 Tax=Neobacillus endophyticus TaxID=2738405 RepID=UPI001566F6E2|nr:hypothetical protein [Neobacillus endophyticus]NRD80836.1 hypothetical protein [Neobacillus endophyticus]